MNEPSPHDEMVELAALFALGTLGQQDADIFHEHLAEGCAACRYDLTSFESVVAELGFGSPEVAPPPGLKEELMSRLKESDKTGPSQLVSITAVEGEWQPVLDGVLIKLLFVDKTTGYITSLVEMMPGTRLPRHHHEGVEQIFVLEGDCRIHGEVLGPGDYHRAEAGSIHENTYTEGGTRFLLIAPENYKFVTG